MHSRERQRLVSTMTVDRAHALGVVLKCSVCLALLTLLLVIGSAREDDGTAPAAAGSALHAAAVPIVPSAAAHRKAVFDDRRARFAGDAHDRVLAGAVPVAPTEPYAP